MLSAKLMALLLFYKKFFLSGCYKFFLVNRIKRSEPECLSPSKFNSFPLVPYNVCKAPFLILYSNVLNMQVDFL